MKGKTTGLLLVGSLAAGILLGWLGGGTSPEAGATGGLPSKAPPRPLGKWDRSHVPVGVRSRLQGIMDGSQGQERMRAMIGLANSVPVEEIETWLDNFYLDTSDAWIDKVCTEILHTRLFEAHPDRFMERCLRLGQVHTEEFMARWTQSDPEAAEAFIEGLSDPKEKTKLTSVLIGELARLQPLRAMDLITQLGDDLKATRGFSNTFAALAKTHRAELLETLRGWPPDVAKQALEQVAAQHSREDLEGALKWMEGEERGRDLFFSVCQLNRAIAPDLIEMAAELPEGWLNSALSRSWYALSRDDPMMWMGVDAESLRVTPGMLDQLQRLAIGQLQVTAENRAEVMALLDEGAGYDVRTRQAAVESIAGGWMAEDRESAEQWVEGLEDEKLREAGLARLNREEQSWEDPPPPAGDLLRHLAGENLAQGGRLYTRQIRNWTANDLAEARASFREMPAEVRDRASRFMIDQANWQVAAPIRSEALSHLVVSGSNGGLSERQFLGRVSETAAQWGRSDPAAAAQWVTSLPEGDAREWAARNVVREWAGHSEQEARSWVEGLNRGAERTLLLEVLEGRE